MSSSRVLSSGLSEQSAVVAADQREKMEAGIDLFAMATVAGLATEHPPPIETISAVESITALKPEIDSPIGDGKTPRPPADAPESAIDEGLWSECFAWMRANVHWYAVSFVVHLIIFAALLFILGRFRLDSNDASGTFQPVDDELALKGRLQNIEIPSGAPEDPTELNANVLLSPEIRAVTAEHNDDSAMFQKEGGGRAMDSDAALVGGAGGFTVRAPGPGPLVAGAGGIGAERGTSDRLGNGGSGDGFAGRGKGHRDAMLRLGGGTKDTEVAVAAALNWFYRHRNANGSWSLSRFAAHCSGIACTGPGTADSDSAATALAVLPFLAAGETQKSRGPYQDAVKQALYFLIRRQAANGDLSGGTGHQMYAHALATLALCEAYGMTNEQKIGDAAQRAVFFIETAQNRATGGWRYVPGEDGDTSVLGWQMMALRSAQLAGLAVNTLTMENAKKWLAVVSKGHYNGLYSYQPYKEATPTMTAIGMLSWQYLGMRPDTREMIEGRQYLMDHLPDNRARSTYYWYYATQAMHNMLGPDWDTWNRQMRRTLLEAQCREGCAAGSWDSELPTLDAWSEQGGRILTTSFSTLSLEVYYRYLPLYNLHPSASDGPPPTINATDEGR